MNMSVRQRTAIRRSTSHPAEGRRMQLVRHLVPALVAGLFWAVPLGAQETTGAVDGKVVDATTQQPLANVEMALAGTPHRERTRRDGSFVQNGVTAGQYRLRATRIGCGSQFQEIAVTAGGTTTAQVSLGAAAAPSAWAARPTSRSTSSTVCRSTMWRPSRRRWACSATRCSPVTR